GSRHASRRGPQATPRRGSPARARADRRRRSSRHEPPAAGVRSVDGGGQARSRGRTGRRDGRLAMCGIAGALRYDPGARPTDEGYVTRMRDTLAHRGPDGAETWVSEDGRIGLGFRRLAIVDLSDAAMQPMPNEDSSVRLVFNGEIYNHRELRREL